MENGRVLGSHSGLRLDAARARPDSQKPKHIVFCIVLDLSPTGIVRFASLPCTLQGVTEIFLIILNHNLIALVILEDTSSQWANLREYKLVADPLSNLSFLI